MTRSLRLAAAALIGLATLFGAAGTTLAARSDVVVGHVYVNNNTAGTNTISGFDRHLDGSLSPTPGTPFTAGGAGTGAPLGSAGALRMTWDHRFLLAVDAGSNQISVLRILPNGALQQWGSPVWSNGTTPVSITTFGPLVYVANIGAGASNYTGFVFDLFGGLHALPGSTYALPDNALPGEVLFSPDGRNLIGTRVGPSNGPSYIDSFSVSPLGRLTPAPNSPFAAQRIGPFGSAFRPTNPNQLFVSNAHDGAGLGSVSAYNVASNGTLTPIGGSPFADNQTAPCWVEVSHDGRYLFAVNTAVPSISSYAIASNGSLSLLGSVGFNSPSGLRPFDAQLDPTGRFLYVVDAGGSGNVSAFSVSGGSVSEIGGSPVSLPGGGSPFGIVVD